MARLRAAAKRFARVGGAHRLLNQVPATRSWSGPMAVAR